MDVSIYLLTLCLPLGTILLVFGMRYFAQVQQARARLAHDAAAFAGINGALADLQHRLSGIEKILKDVE